MSSRIDQLRSLLVARFPGTVVSQFGDSAAARPSQVQLLPGRMVEMVAAAGCGGEGLLMRDFCEKAAAAGTLALVDGADALDASMLSGATRQRLLWLRCRGAPAAIRAADLLLRDGNLTTVLMDLRLLPERELLRLPSSVWHRLRMLAERAQVAVGVFSPCRLVPCAVSRWVMSPVFGVEALEEEAAQLATRLHALPAADALAIAS